MGSEKQNVTSRVDPQTRADVEQYQEVADKDSLAEASSELLEKGLLATRWPRLMYVRELALDALYYISLLACTLVILGFGSTMLGAERAVSIALTLFVTAFAPLTAIECWLAIHGESELLPTGEDD